MRVLVHIHTFNDADVIDDTIQSVLKQTRPVDGIVVVDNASRDATLRQPSLKHATIVRHQENQGTSGAIVTGMRFALEQGYDWIWIFDADSSPEPDALEKLLNLYASWPRGLQDETAFLTCLDNKEDDSAPRHGGLFTERGLAPNVPVAGARYQPCHFTVWSGCLYRLAAVREIGVPNADYVLDWGEGEYGYRVLKAGYKGFVCCDAVFCHNVRGYVSIRPTKAAADTVYEFPAIRCYYSCRNMLYFVFYELDRGRRRMFLRSLVGPVRLTLNLLMRPRNHGRHIRACVRGIWDGVTGNIAARY